jgi:hypothetical protein
MREISTKVRTLKKTQIDKDLARPSKKKEKRLNLVKSEMKEETLQLMPQK